MQDKGKLLTSGLEVVQADLEQLAHSVVCMRTCTGVARV